MALLNILQFPDTRLKNKAAPVEQFDNALSLLIDNMFETMYETQGIGLAAIQVNIQQRVIVIDVSREGNQPLVLINPEIIHKQDMVDSEEGCLSFPGVYAKVKRAKTIEAKYWDRDGKENSITAENLLSFCIQHELDHLDGITFYDHLSPLKKDLLRKKIEKLRKMAF